MISVPNRLLPLNGNKLGLFLFLSLFFFSACGIFNGSSKPEPRQENEELDIIEGKRKYNSETGEWEYVTEVEGKVDTLELEIIPADEEPPISSDETDKMEEAKNERDDVRRTSFKLAYLLPFLSNRFDPYENELDQRSVIFLNFYEGVKMALDSLQKYNLELEVRVYDTKASPREVANILEQPEFEEVDVVIGPYRSMNTQIVSNFTKKNKRIHISPFLADTEKTTEHPSFVQITPSFRAHSEAIVKNARKYFLKEQIVLICRDKPEEVERLELFQEANGMIDGLLDSTSRLKEFIVDEEDVDFTNVDLKPFFDQNEEGDTMAFILPSWSNESFVYSFLRKINIDRKGKPVVVYGMPQWMDFDLISYEYYENLNVRVSSSEFIDREDPAVNAFRKAFYKRYGMPPTSEAFLGYDATLFLGKMLAQDGFYFFEKLDEEYGIYLHNRFNFERVVNDPESAEVDPDKYDYLENKHINILEFKDYQFQKMN